MSDGVVQTAGRAGEVASSRKTIRYGTAALAVVVGVLYLLIAVQVIHVAETTGNDSPFVPMMAAAVAFWLGAVLLVAMDRWLVWVLGCGVQLVVLVGYFLVASSRDPRYEMWGVLIKVAQIVILGLLLYLVVTTRPRSRAAE